MTEKPIQELSLSALNEDNVIEPLQQNLNESDIDGNNTKSKLFQTTITATPTEDQLMGEENEMEPLRLEKSDIINGNIYEFDIVNSQETNDYEKDTHKVSN